jgi:hypothetical protein
VSGFEEVAGFGILDAIVITFAAVDDGGIEI